MYTAQDIESTPDCICGKPKAAGSVFCSKHIEEFNAWYRLGLDDGWASERQRRGMTMGTKALIEWANESEWDNERLLRSICAGCDKPVINDYLCPECRHVDEE